MSITSIKNSFLSSFFNSIQLHLRRLGSRTLQMKLRPEYGGHQTEIKENQCKHCRFHSMDTFVKSTHSSLTYATWVLEAHVVKFNVSSVPSISTQVDSFMIVIWMSVFDYGHLPYVYLGTIVCDKRQLEIHWWHTFMNIFTSYMDEAYNRAKDRMGIKWNEQVVCCLKQHKWDCLKEASWVDRFDGKGILSIEFFTIRK